MTLKSVIMQLPGMHQGAFRTAAALCLIAPAAMAQQHPPGLEIRDGQCEDSSHTAEGPIGSDLTKRQSRFYCDGMAFSGQGDRLQISFVVKRSDQPSLITFAGGALQPNKVDLTAVMPVYRIYVKAGQATPVTEGQCEFFFKNDAISNVMCAAKVDTKERRFVAIVVFDVHQ